MYQKGEYINYAAHGICQIEDIRMMDFRTGSGQRNQPRIGAPLTGKKKRKHQKV